MEGVKYFNIRRKSSGIPNVDRRVMKHNRLLSFTVADILKY